ncbi:polysaccharide deacetylase family protein [Marinobacter oulmenensis]|uniref:Peptidoglycan/xylan/chitin deacetylase (PgdA/CDA1 family) n=1 Tax=Marinobacter oulmenensis TaxID=643747 RepID=A0A840UDY9_9GAMM|nr:polysaccharide deacetylase family protein [Marinobacter oulmenensis]MBB5322413.1 peptidoglycan/xylan/chitin deacetylase (PgdA/CDA1 family) [Marinobacter oulmenensis]
MQRNLAYRLLLTLCLAAPSAQADLVVLQYHHVDDTTPNATSTSPELFEAQLDRIRELGLEVVPLMEGTRQAMAGDGGETNQVALTFDDAYESVYRQAAPLLEERQLPYTVFVNTDAVGSHGYMNWSQLKEIKASGLATIGNHSTDHDHLAQRPNEPESDWEARIEHSLDAAQQAIESQLGEALPLFAYPYGEYDKALENRLAARDWLGFGQHSGAIGPTSGDTRLPRFPMANAYGKIDSLRNKLLSRAFPVAASELPDGVLEQNPPLLTFPVSDPLSPSRLTCFASGLGRIEIENNGGVVRVQAPQAIDGRRFRYNCTHPAGQGSYYWLSQQWLNLEAPED